MNPSITWKDIQENPDRPWDWFATSINKLPLRFDSKERIIERTLIYKEELMMACWSPERLGKMLEKGYRLEDIE